MERNTKDTCMHRPSSLIFLIALPLFAAFNFSPMSQSIDLGEQRRGAQFLIENDGASNIAVELSVRERRMAEDGTETLGETTDITVFPPQIIIPPGDKRTVRVSYTLKDIPEREKNYRLIAEQLPLKVDAKSKAQAGIKMLMKYVAALYATPPNTRADIKLISHKRVGEELLLELENQGGRHRLVTNPVLRYVKEGKQGELRSADLPGLAGENVLAGQRRLFRIKSPKEIPLGAKVDLKIDD